MKFALVTRNSLAAPARTYPAITVTGPRSDGQVTVEILVDAATGTWWRTVCPTMADAVRLTQDETRPWLVGCCLKQYEHTRRALKASAKRNPIAAGLELLNCHIAYRFPLV